MTTGYAHTPVMTAQVSEYLAPEADHVVVDATVGGAGHSCALYRQLGPGGFLVGIDQDESALAAAEQRLAECAAQQKASGQTPAAYLLLKGNFRDLDRLLAGVPLGYVDRILFDIGVSSPQLDDERRGFSYHPGAPLDMRMDPDGAAPTAAEILAASTEAELAALLRNGGEERWASRIAHFIVCARAQHPLHTSDDLVEVVKAAIPARERRAGGHPARRTFQALRIAVNDELGALQQGLDCAVGWLAPGGRIGVITFHSLEDRLVKTSFAAWEDRCICPPDLPVCACGRGAILAPLTRGALRVSTAEAQANPRARSARLRVARRSVPEAIQHKKNTEGGTGTGHHLSEKTEERKSEHEQTRKEVF
ncbi:MAG: 16S rRNA (cytosine(1402)-N(4))-methyltransferase RsmH [Coriobacteriia bacterium]|nr:16S rRNA (cytosine(1402)-N(4))-methyltransferase RsmH [Coriobacteriia bacterium]